MIPGMAVIKNGSRHPQLSIRSCRPPTEAQRAEPVHFIQPIVRTKSHPSLYIVVLTDTSKMGDQKTGMSGSVKR